MSAKIARRTFLSGLGTAPVLGAVHALNMHHKPAGSRGPTEENKPLRLGIIGFGFRGEQLARAANFAHPDWISTLEKGQHGSTALVLEDYKNQQDLNIEINGICDIFDQRLNRGIEASGEGTRSYTDYRELLASNDIDAVIIATPDHWHARMAMEAARRGKHIYLEKCMTRTAEEAVQVREAVRKSGVVFQLGHQGRQRDLNLKAREVIANGTLGKITLIETTTNRNNPTGAWVYPFPEKLDESSIRWDLFQEPVARNIGFSPERFFRWRCFWDYGTGLSGDLLTHEYDAVNTIMELGIPHSASASGGIYYYKDGREVPDVFQVSFEYPERDLTLTYSATLASGISRGTLFMGHDATLELGRSLSIWVDKESGQYRSRIEAGIIDPSAPIARYDPGQKGVDAISSPTTKYFADRGLMYTYREGARVNPTNLHLGEWIRCIQTGGQPSCHIEQGFQEAITAHMATLSYLEGRRVKWDPVMEKII
jgi:predicted dehydrogenase